MSTRLKQIWQYISMFAASEGQNKGNWKEIIFSNWQGADGESVLLFLQLWRKVAFRRLDKMYKYIICGTGSIDHATIVELQSSKLFYFPKIDILVGEIRVTFKIYYP